ncbi:MAG: head GIN domain-containing protein [Bacteroidia bacterium]
MKKQVSFLTFCLVFIISLTGCSKEWCGVEGAGPVTTESRLITGFHGIDLELSGTVVITTDSVYSVTVSTYQNYQGLIHFQNHGGKLTIDSYKSLQDDNIRIEIHVPSLDYLSVGGSGRILTSNMIQGSYLKLHVSGSGKLDISANLQTTDADVSGSGSLYMNGAVNTARMNVSGSGTIHAYPMKCQTNNAIVSGSGRIETHVISALDANISGSGDIFYIGFPTLYTHISGSGSLVNKN